MPTWGSCRRWVSSRSPSTPRMNSASSWSRRMFAHPRHLGRDQSGTTTIEFTIVALLFLLLTFGLLEFGHMFWQYNSATKAAQHGARLAAVSNPVWSGLVTLEDTGTPGAAWETDYVVTCDGEGEDCTDLGEGEYDDE